MTEPTCTAADGKTVVYSIPGYPLMVRAVDFNTLFGSTHNAAPGAPQQEASGNDKRWAAYVANMIETYLQFDQPKRNPPDERIAAIAGIIERRMVFLTRAAATAPADGVTDAERSAILGLAAYAEGSKSAEVVRWAMNARAACERLTTAARAAESVIHLGAEGQKVFAETLLNPPPPTAAFLKTEDKYNNLIQPEVTAPADEAPEALKDAVAHLAGAASAYRTYAKRHASQGKALTDPFFSTRIKDFDAAVERGRAALTTTARAAEPESSRLWNALIDLPGARRRIWNHVIDNELKAGHNSIESVLLAASPTPTPPTGTSKEGCQWCCSTGRFSDHACRICGGSGVAKATTSQGDGTS